MKYILFSTLLVFMHFGHAQTPDLTIIPSGIEFSDGTQQISTATSEDNGSNYNWSVYAEYSNGIIGDVTVSGYENHSFILRFHHEIFRALNPNGLPMNDQHHKALLLEKDIDKASVDLYNVFNNNSVIDQIKIKFVRPLGNGSSAEKFRITLNNVKIAEIKNEIDFVQEAASYKGAQSVRLVYENISVQHFSPNDNVTLEYQY